MPEIEVFDNRNDEELNVVTKKAKLQALWKDVRGTLIFTITFVLIYVLCFQMIVVVGASMNDTLVEGDRLLLLNNRFYRNPEPGDIVVISKASFKDGQPVIKRIIAIEGQEVNIDFETGTVHIDGVALNEPYVSSPTLTAGGMAFPLTVPENCVFVMGDNRMNSLDSRDIRIGIVKKEEIIGKAIFLILPGFDTSHTFNWKRIGPLVSIN